MAILNKRQNYQLWRAGAFGNKLRSWTVEEYIQSDFAGEVAIRMRSGIGNGHCFCNVNRECALDALPFLTCDGLLADDFMVNEMAPEADSILKGEFFNGVLQDGMGLPLSGYLFYSTCTLPMREALRLSNRDTYGLRADMMIRQAMTDSSYEDWRDLLDLYPDHVLEVSIYNRCLGDIPNRNALVWEVRRY